MKRKYKILRLVRVYNDVEMLLREIKPPKTEPVKPAYEPDLKRIAVPILKTDEEKVAYDVLSAIRKFSPELFERPTSPAGGFAIGPARSLVTLSMTISLEDYKNLGSPALEDILELTLTKK